MRTIDIKSFTIGVLVSLLVFVGVAATTTNMLTSGRYSVTTSAADGMVYICSTDTETGQFCLAQYATGAKAARSNLPPLTIIGTFKNPLGKEEQIPAEPGAPTGPFGH